MKFDIKAAETYYREAFGKLRKTDNIPDITVSYYPYVNTNHTIRVRQDRVFVRVSDTFTIAPPEVHRALAFILVAKLLSKRIPKPHNELYRNFINSDSFSALALERKKKKGRKVLTSPIGTSYDLSQLFSELNEVYFENELELPVLSWSKRLTYRRLGHHDPAHNVIVISKSLDSDRVPAFVVAFVLYHEMLHIKHPQVFKNGRRYVHTAKFRADEEDFEFFSEAESWIEENAGRLKRYAKRYR